MILHVHTTNNIWFILGNSLIQEGKHMDGKLEGTLWHYFESKRRKRQLIKEEEKRAPKCSPSWPDLICQNTFWCFAHNLISLEFFLLPSLISRSSSLWIWPRSYRVNCYIAHSCTCELKQADHKKRSSNFGVVVGELASKGNKFSFDYWKTKKKYI